MIKKSRPFSNGMEYEFFKECWCENCTHYKVRENDGFPEFPENGGCRILDCMENARFDERFWPNKKIVEDWESGEVKRWHKCLDFERRADHMSMKRRRKTTYISGPIIGWPAEEVIEKFEHTEQLIRDRGEVPINPLKLCNLNMTYEECMRKDITVMLLQADKIYMIAGYENSDGAELELDVAEMCGMEVEYEEEPEDE